MKIKRVAEKSCKNPNKMAIQNSIELILSFSMVSSDFFPSCFPFIFFLPLKEWHMPSLLVNLLHSENIFLERICEEALSLNHGIQQGTSVIHQTVS